MASFETREPDWLSFDEALGRMESIGPALPAAHRPLENVLGLAIAEDVRAGLTLPPGRTSHMDGYALRAADVVAGENGDVSLPIPVVGASRPGAPWRSGLAAGSAVRIMTGALLPDEADTVVPVEETDSEAASAGTLRVSFGRAGQAITKGRHVRPPGEELQAGEVLASPGETVTPGLLALLSATGEPSVPVHRAPSVALLVTGDELVPAGDPAALSDGVFRADVLSPTLPPLIRHGGGAPLPPRRVGDDHQVLLEAMAEAASKADLIFTTGGASMGEGDLVKRVLEDMGFELDFWRARMRPGSPVSLGRLRGSGGKKVAVIGLPGNPVSAFVTFLVLGLPALRALGGHRRRGMRRIIATAGERLGGPPSVTRFFRVRLERDSAANMAARLSAEQGSGVIRSLATADGLAVVPQGTDAVEEGDPVEVLLVPFAEWE